ncbi:MAG: peroxiredoxin family protein [Bryobacteraceae bacterium]
MKRFFAVALIVTLALTVVFQAVTNHRLYSKLRDAKRELPALHRPFPPLRGTTPLGLPVAFDFAGTQTPAVLLAFYPECPYCQQNWPNWKAIAARAEAKGIRVYYVNVTPDPVSSRYCAKLEIPCGDVLNSVSSENILMYRLDRTPITEIIDSKGQLLYQVSGLLDKTAMERLESFLTIAAL